MKKYLNFNLLIAAICLIFVFGCQPKTDKSSVAGDESKGLLYEYVHQEDPNFQYEVVHTKKDSGYTYHVIRMVSQKWLTPDVVDEVEWWHWVSVVVPDGVTYETGMMWVGGGSRKSKMPEKADEIILEAAMRTNSIAAQVHNIPFQPLTFANDTVGERYEDALIAYGWRKFLEGGAKDEDAEWLARLPMTKSVVLAMDVVSEVVGNVHKKKLDKFVIAGASKRGWTTWTTAAVDDRVVGIIPIVIDLLNVVPSFQHHWRSYGFWAPAVDDYVQEGIMEWMGTEEFDRLLEITEPYSFIDRYDMPKLLINATGDQFFLPDSWQFYWEELKGEKHLQYVPNVGHDVRKDTDALQNLIAFYDLILKDIPRPSYKWTVTANGFIIETNPNQKIANIKLWQAHNEEARDFRIDVFGPQWSATEIMVNESGKYEILLETPEVGWKGYFVEITFAGQAPMKVTTGVEVLPKKYPFEAFEPDRKD